MSRTPTRRTADLLTEAFTGLPCRTAQAQAVGVTQARLRAAVAAGTVLRMRPGVFLPAAVWAAVGEEERHLLRVRSVLLVAAEGSLAGYESGAVVHGMARPRYAMPRLVHVVAPGRGDRRRIDDVRMHEGGAVEKSRAVVAGIPVTTVARTAVDLARTRSLARGLISCDSALRLMLAAEAGVRPDDARALRGLVRDGVRVELARAALSEVLADEVYGWPHTVMARRAVACADPAAESAHESRSRAWVIEAGLPLPELGVSVEGADGRTYWVDFLWRAYGLVGEADGWSKYRDAPFERFQEEKRRQEAIEATGLRFVRWTTDRGRDEVVALIRTALRQRLTRLVVVN